MPSSHFCVESHVLKPSPLDSCIVATVSLTSFSNGCDVESHWQAQLGSVAYMIMMIHCEYHALQAAI